MGLVYISATVSNDGQSATLQFLVDSGAKYTLLPLDTWKALGLEPIKSMRFVLADGTAIERNISECLITLPPHGSLHTPVILGHGGDDALLGVITLEEFGLILNPFQRTLEAARMMLAVMASGQA
ncbi:MAG TPA: aspartyl protease family protein [Terriglobia bacterium]|nr:aspartyl protease family protein [Terriglobia bacterium]